MYCFLICTLQDVGFTLYSLLSGNESVLAFLHFQNEPLIDFGGNLDQGTCDLLCLHFFDGLFLHHFETAAIFKAYKDSSCFACVSNSCKGAPTTSSCPRSFFTTIFIWRKWTAGFSQKSLHVQECSIISWASGCTFKYSNCSKCSRGYVSKWRSYTQPDISWRTVTFMSNFVMECVQFWHLMGNSSTILVTVICLY